MTEEKNQGRSSISKLLPKNEADKILKLIDIRIEQATRMLDNMTAELKTLNAERKIYQGIKDFHDGGL